MKFSILGNQTTVYIVGKSQQGGTMSKSVIIILLVLCGIVCTTYSAPVSTQKYANVKEVLNLLNQMANQQSGSRTKAAEALSQAMKDAAAQLIGPCPHRLGQVIMC